MNELARIRAEIAKARRNATSKISRTKRKTGASVAGTQFDPRRGSGVEQRYNLNQAKAYLNKLQLFNQRNVQFVSGAGGTPLPRHRWNYAQQRASQVEHAGAQHMASMADLPTMNITGGVNKDMTVGQALAMRPKIARPGANQVVSGPYSTFNKESTDIASAEALETLISVINAKLSPKYLPTKIQQGRENLMKALDMMGEQEWMEQVERLTDYQFDALWFGSPTAIESVFLKYDIMTDNAAKSSKEKWQDRVVQRESDEFGEFLNWAEKEVPANRPAYSTEKPKPTKQIRKIR